MSHVAHTGPIQTGYEPEQSNFLLTVGEQSDLSMAAVGPLKAFSGAF